METRRNIEETLNTASPDQCFGFHAESVVQAGARVETSATRGSVACSSLDRSEHRCGNAIDVETVILDILRNTHDGGPWLGSVSCKPHSAAQRIAGWPILTSGAFINDGHQRFAVFIEL